MRTEVERKKWYALIVRALRRALKWHSCFGESSCSFQSPPISEGNTCSRVVRILCIGSVGEAEPKTREETEKEDVEMGTMEWHRTWLQ